jgi:hypothetical protein
MRDELARNDPLPTAKWSTRDPEVSYRPKAFVHQVFRPRGWSVYGA